MYIKSRYGIVRATCQYIMGNDYQKAPREIYISKNIWFLEECSVLFTTMSALLFQLLKLIT